MDWRVAREIAKVLVGPLLWLLLLLLVGGGYARGDEEQSTPPVVGRPAFVAVSAGPGPVCEPAARLSLAAARPVSL